MSDAWGGGVLSHGHVFGLKSDVKNNVHYAEENVVIYPCGHNVVLFNIETRAQQVIHGSLSGGITALALTCNRRFLAIAESGLLGKGPGFVNIYDAATLKRRKMIACPELGSPIVTCVAFSGDGRFCLTQGGSPEWKLILWTAEKAAKVICTVKVSSSNLNGDPAPPVNQADFCPVDGTVVCVTGERILRFFRVADSQFKPLQLSYKAELQNYTCHCWLTDEKVVTASDQGDLLVFETYEFRGVLSSSPGDGHLISSMVAFSKGFVTGGSEGAMRVYERSDDPREFYRCLKVFHINGNASLITNLAVSPSEDNLALTTSNNQIYSFALSNTDILKEDTMNFDHIAGPFPMPGKNRSGPTAARINGVDVCIWKPLVATVSVDFSLRVWNFQEKTLELIKFFEDVPLGISLHPSGLYILLAFKEKVRLYSILMDDVRQLKEFTAKHSHTISFSKGGQYFAISSNTQVHIYDTYTCVIITQLKGHQGKVRSIVWKDQDRRILTASSEGQIHIWDASTGRRSQEAFQLRSSIYAAAASGDFTRQFCIGDDMHIRELDLMRASIDSDGLIKSQLATNVTIGTLEVADHIRVLLAGTAQMGTPGSVRAYQIGRVGGGFTELSPEFKEFACLSGPVTCMAQSHDGSLLFVGGEDGALAMYTVAEDAKAAERKAREREATEYTEEILVTRTELSIQSKAMQGLKNSVDELVLNNEYQLRLKDMNYKEKIREVTEKFAVEVEMDRRHYEELLEERKNMELEYEEKIRDQLNIYNQEETEVDTQHQNKINAEISRYQAMVHEKEKLNHQWDNENQALVDKHTEHLQCVTDEYDAKVEEVQAQQHSLAEEKEAMTKAFENLRSLVEKDADTEAEFVKVKYLAKLAAEREATLRLKGENGIMKKKFLKLNKQVDNQKEDISSLQERQRDFFETIKGLEKDIQGHKKEIREREETIADKEKRIYDLKKKNQELEKFKFVLDYKIKELKRQIEPRENEIGDMRNQIEEMDLELEQYHKSNSALDLMVGELRLKMDGMQKEIVGQTQKMEEGRQYVQHFHSDLGTAAQSINSGDSNMLKAAMITLYRQYMQDYPSAKLSRGDENFLQEEYNRQREHLERNVEALKRNIDKDVHMFHQDRSRLNRENVVLTREINELRRKAKSLALRQQAVEKTMAGDMDVSPALLFGDTANPANAAPTKGGKGGTESNGWDPDDHKRKINSTSSKRLTVASSRPGSGSLPTPPSGRQVSTHFGRSEIPHREPSRENNEELWREIGMQEEQIKQLKQHVAQLWEIVADSGGMASDVPSQGPDRGENVVLNGIDEAIEHGANGTVP